MFNLHFVCCDISVSNSQVQHGDCSYIFFLNFLNFSILIFYVLGYNIGVIFAFFGSHCSGIALEDFFISGSNICWQDVLESVCSATKNIAWSLCCYLFSSSLWSIICMIIIILFCIDIRMKQKCQKKEVVPSWQKKTPKERVLKVFIKHNSKLPVKYQIPLPSQVKLH